MDEAISCVVALTLLVLAYRPGLCGGQPTTANRTEGPCATGSSAVAFRKCCPTGRAYDAGARICRPLVDGGHAKYNDDGGRAAAYPIAFVVDHLRRPAAAVCRQLDGPPKCDGTRDVLVDVRENELRELINGASDNGSVAAPDGYCFDVIATKPQELVARTCRSRERHCGRGNTCANKCCSGDRMVVDGKCKNSDVPFQPPVYDIADNGTEILVNNTLLPIYIKLQCSDRHEIKNIKLYADGRMYRIETGVFYSQNNYCLDYFKNANKEAQLRAQICLKEFGDSAQTKKGSWKYVLMLGGLIPSIICLVLTLIVYAILSSLRNVHGYYVMCYVAFLLISYIFLFVIQWMQDALSLYQCILFGYLTLFAFLTTFCWLNVICFDIYWILRYNSPRPRNTSIPIRTIFYIIYCVGFSCTLTSTAFYFQRSQRLSKDYTPDIGNDYCWFSKDALSKQIFFTLPVSIMLIANIILFVLTTIHCIRIKSELNKFKRTDTKAKRFKVDKIKFIMSIKLFLVMGIPWIFEILATFFHNNGFIWHISDEINTLQGVMIFIIFVAKRKVIMSLRKKMTNSLDHSESTKMNTLTGSSFGASSHNNF